MAERRIRTRDGQLVGIGDEVWTENHRPWIIVEIFDRLGSPWAAMKTRYEQSDLDSDSEVPLDWANRMLYRNHPPPERSAGQMLDCDWAGCRHRPWGPRR